jgi:hypothetical protein
MPQPWSVPRDWPGETVAVLAAGPSMSREICDRLRGRCRTIAVNNVGIDTVESTTGVMMPALAPWADVLFASDAKWWRTYHDRAVKFAGLKIGTLSGPSLPEIKRVAFSGNAPFDERPERVVSGGNSGYQAVHIAAHFGAARILLFGFDMRDVNKRRHYFGNHPAPCNSQGRYGTWITNFKRLAAALEKRGVMVVNCTPGSALHVGRVSTLDAEFPLELSCQSLSLPAAYATA